MSESDQQVEGIAPRTESWSGYQQLRGSDPSRDGEKSLVHAAPFLSDPLAPGGRDVEELTCSLFFARLEREFSGFVEPAGKELEHEEI